MSATMSGIMTAFLLILFIGIWVWSWSSRRKTAFDRMAQLPLEDDDLLLPGSSGRSTSTKQQDGEAL